MLLSDDTTLAALTLKTSYTQGWNTWNSFHEEIEEKVVRESAEILISSGLAAAGAGFPLLLTSSLLSLMPLSSLRSTLTDASVLCRIQVFQP